MTQRRDAMRGMPAVPQVVEHNQAHPTAEYISSPNVTELYEVILRAEA